MYGVLVLINYGIIVSKFIHSPVCHLIAVIIDESATVF